MKKLVTGVLAAALAVLPAFAVTPAVSAAEQPFGSGIWLAQDAEQVMPSFYLFYGGGIGSVRDASTGYGVPFDFAASDEAHAVFRFGRGEAETSAALAEQPDGSLQMNLSDGRSIRMTYLQPYTPEDYSKVFRMGDLTCDGNLSAYDAELLDRCLQGDYQLSPVQAALADLNGSGSPDADDLTHIQRTGFTTALAKAESACRVMLDVMEFCQHPLLPTGCESAALYMLLQYYRTDVTLWRIVQTLPKGPAPHTENGVNVGANPEREFVGDPFSEHGYGVYNEPVAQTAAQFRMGVQTQTGAPLSEVIRILETGNPVMVWYTTAPESGIIWQTQWYDYETGELVRWPSNEHAVVICGYDSSSDTFTYRDPNTGGTRTVKQADFQPVYDALGGRILYYNG
ncbi:MAG TPA: hypothetical protein DDX71_00405 [Ruminococcus sp.]|nr:hypothetical protein [Ruminococcus sp.]